MLSSNENNTCAGESVYGTLVKVIFVHSEERVSKDLTLRNQMIYDQYAAGSSLQEIALQYDLTPQRISQIVAQYNPEVNDDDARALSVAKLQWVEAELLKMMTKRYPKIDVKGCVVHDDSGNVLYDSEPIIRAADVFRKINAEIRRAGALDKPRRKQMAEDEAMKQAKEFLSKVFQGEVIREE